METLKNRHEIKLKKPARYWDDGLPIGNGRLGAMVMGKVNEETIYLNEETIWYGRDLDRKISGSDPGAVVCRRSRKSTVSGKNGDHIDSQIYESVSAGGRFKDLYVSSQRKGRTV